MFGPFKRWYRSGLDWDWFTSEIRKVIKPGDTLLDAGAGECQWAKIFPDCRYIALDNKVGDSNWDYSKVHITADLNDHIPMDDNSVDVIICIQVLEHLNSPLRALQEMQRVLKPGGYLFMTTPFSYMEHQQPYDFYRYTRYGLKYLIENAGMMPENIAPMGGYFLLLRDQLMHFHHSRFYSHHVLLSLLSWLPRQVIKFWNLAVMPPILYALDKLDREKIHTLGHSVIARKPA
jgi:SAM-dependent methyltransferase